jgi:succinate dehydrogenase / fumarate reductase, flavoprotein subunit
MSSSENAATDQPMHIDTDVLVIGSGAAGMYAALEAARASASVILAERSLIGRGGATVMAQMTVAAALAEQTPDHWEHHLSDTLAAGRGLCDEGLAALLCEDGPRRLREMDDWKSVGRGKTVISSRRRRQAMIARAAPMSTFCRPVRRCRGR